MAEWDDGRKLTHDELLLWLNDHLGMAVTATVEIDQPEVLLAPVLYAFGELRHWSASGPSSAWVAHGRDRDDIAGLYEIGDATSDRLVQLDVTELAVFDASLVEIDDPPEAPPGTRAEQVRVTLGEYVALEIIAYIRPAL